MLCAVEFGGQLWEEKGGGEVGGLVRKLFFFCFGLCEFVIGFGMRGDMCKGSQGELGF